MPCVGVVTIQLTMQLSTQQLGAVQVKNGQAMTHADPRTPVHKDAARGRALVFTHDS